MNSFRFLHMMRQLRRGCSFSTLPKENYEKLLNSIFPEDTQIRLLEFFNKCTESDLQRTKNLYTFAKDIVAFRSKIGEIKTLSSLLNVPDIGLSKLHIACAELQSKDLSNLMELTSASTIYKRVQPYPKITVKQCQEIDSLIALDVQSDRITWVKINRDLEVVNWQQTLIFDRSYQIYDHMVYGRKIGEFIESLPETSIYVMEKKSHKVTHLRYVNYIGSLRILEAVVTTMFNSKDLDKVFLMKNQPIASLFSLNVGGERISGKDTVSNIMNGAPVVNERILVSPDIANNYQQADSGQQEKFADVLLLGLAFYKLVVFAS